MFSLQADVFDTSPGFARLTCGAGPHTLCRGLQERHSKANGDTGAEPDVRSDEELMDAYLDGDEAAFEVLFERYASRLTALMMRRLDDAGRARELVQQTFLHFHRARNDFDRGSEVRPWLYTIALNLRRDHLRAKGRRPEYPTDQFDDRGEANRRIETMADRQLVGLAMDELTDKLRSVVELHWFEELTFSEIAETLGISRSAAKVRAHRAYKQMRTFIEETEGNPSSDVTDED